MTDERQRVSAVQRCPSPHADLRTVTDNPNVQHALLPVLSRNAKAQGMPRNELDPTQLRSQCSGRNRGRIRERHTALPLCMKTAHQSQSGQIETAEHELPVRPGGPKVITTLCEYYPIETSAAQRRKRHSPPPQRRGRGQAVQR